MSTNCNKRETQLTLFSLLGGFLILLIGVLYIAFEQSLLAQSSTSKEDLEAAEADYVSRLILGAQVGLVALAMLVTRSSVASLQAKTGLPLGTQILGWITLGKCTSFPFHLTQHQTSHCALGWLREASIRTLPAFI